MYLQSGRRYATRATTSPQKAKLRWGRQPKTVFHRPARSSIIQQYITVPKLRRGKHSAVQETRRNNNSKKITIVSNRKKKGSFSFGIKTVAGEAAMTTATARDAAMTTATARDAAIKTAAAAATVAAGEAAATVAVR